jgi:hypothetical protein
MATKVHREAVGGHDIKAAICICPTQELAQEVAEWLYADYVDSIRQHALRLRRPFKPGERPVPVGRKLLAIVDATDVEGVGGHLVFWPERYIEAPGMRMGDVEKVSVQFGRRGVLFWTRRSRGFLGPRRTFLV